MQMGRIQKDSTLFLFRQVTKTKRGEYLKNYGAISYTTLREQFKAKMKYLGYQADKFGIHSLRAGGAQMQMYQIICLKDMADGDQRMPRMFISKIH